MTHEVQAENTQTGACADALPPPGPSRSGLCATGVTCRARPPTPATPIGGLWTKYGHLLPAPAERPEPQPQQGPRSLSRPGLWPCPRARNNSHAAAMLARKRPRRGGSLLQAPARSRSGGREGLLGAPARSTPPRLLCPLVSASGVELPMGSLNPTGFQAA